jgi:hypothetical protein
MVIHAFTDSPGAVPSIFPEPGNGANGCEGIPAHEEQGIQLHNPETLMERGPSLHGGKPERS